MMKKFLAWIDARFPWTSFCEKHFKKYYVPKNLNFWYYFGSLALFVFVSQFVTGLWLTMFYTPSAKDAFDSVEYIMRDVHYGWLIRYLHSTGASLFFVVIYLHIFRGLLYGSHKKPRELLWVFGALLFLLMMAEAFFGYLLPWGQMSYWGAQVITSLFGAIPYIGDTLALWLRGDYTIADATLHRFFALHVAGLPVLFVIMIYLHLVALHHVGSNNPEGIDIKKDMRSNDGPKDTVAFHPYYTLKDTFGLVVFLFVFLSIVFFFPEMGGYFLEYANFEPASPLVTPEHIAPVWYMTPFYSILRAIPDKLLGIAAMASSVAFLFVLPWLDRSPVRAMKYRGPLSKVALTLFVLSFLTLGYLGTVSVTPLNQWVARIATTVYFAFFILMPIYTRIERCKSVPTCLKEAR